MPWGRSPTDVRRYHDEGFWRDEPVWEDLAASFAAEPERTALELEDRALTFGELDRAAASLAARLHDEGVHRGETVAILGRNSLEGAVALAAAFRLGAVLAPVPPMFSAAQIGALVDQCDARALIAHGGKREIEKCESVHAGRHRFLGFDGELLDELLSDGAVLAPNPLPPDDTNLLLHSSGTTATPKGIVHTGNTLRYASEQVQERWQLSPADRYLIVCEFGFVGSILFGYLPAMLDGASTVLLPRWDPVAALETMEEKAISYVILMPTHTSDVLNDADGSRYDLSAMRAFAAPGLTPERRAAFQEVFGHKPLADYGLSEVPGNCAHGLDEPEAKVLKTEGLPFRGTEVRILDPDGNPLPPGGQGEIEIDGPSRLAGFLGNEALAHELIAPWGGYRTGDVGYLDEDGHLVYLGRSKDTIERAGVQIVPSEVEPVLLEHPAIREVALVPLPHERLGETICAAIILVGERDGVELEDLQSFLLERDVAKYTWPESIEFFDEFPRTSSLKPVKGKIVEEILARNPTPAQPPRR